MDSYYEEQCLVAMEIGMTYEQYWYSEPELFSYYMEIAIKKQKQEVNLTDTRAWLAGRYVLMAINTALDTKHKCKYPEQPYSIKNDPEYKRKKLDAGWNNTRAALLSSPNIQVGNTIKPRTSTTN